MYSHIVGNNIKVYRPYKPRALVLIQSVVINVKVRLTRNRSVVSLSPIKDSHGFIEQGNLPSLLSTDSFQE